MTRSLVIFSQVVTFCLLVSAPASEAATWVITTSVATVEYSSGTPIPKNSRFCLVPESRDVRVSLEGGATQALVQSETSGSRLYLQSGTHTLTAGCYAHMVGNYYSGPGEIPKTQIWYSKRVADPGISLPGFSRQPYIKAGTSLIDGGNSNLGDIERRFLIDVYGLDDKLSVKVNGTVVLSKGFNAVNVYEVTQDLRDGSNTVLITASDNNDGRCWDFGFRVGDANSWKTGAHYANTPCGSSLPKNTKVVYRKSYSFNFKR